MNKTAQIELHRIFLIEKLPEPLTRASSHLQLYDNYIENTRLRLRLVRDPYSKAWTRVLQQRSTSVDAGLSTTRMSEIHLNDTEYAVFKRFEGREVRKNRYYHEFDRVLVTFDSYLGRLWGLYTARVDFDSHEEMAKFEAPPFAIFEVTNDPFFDGANLVERSFEDVRAEIAKVGADVPPATGRPDE